MTYWESVGGRTLSHRFIAALQETFDAMLLFPLAGAPLRSRSERLHDVRTWPVRGFRSYLVYYRLTGELIDVLHVLHAARDRDPILEPLDDEPA